MLFQFKNGEWDQTPLKKDPSNDVFADVDGFYSLTRDRQKPKLVSLHSAYCKATDGRTESQDFAHEITIDGEGYLKTIPIPELSLQYIFDEEMEKPEDVYRRQSPEIQEMRKLLVPLSIESFDPPPEKSGDENAQPAATADAGIGQNASPPNRDEKSEIRNENLETKEPAKANHFWLYAGAILLFSVVFCFLRKRFSARPSAGVE